MLFVNRHVKIAVKDEKKIWSHFQEAVFNDFHFQMPNIFSSVKPSEIGANIYLDFIPDNPSLLTHAQVGGDPFLRPYMYIHVLSIKNNEKLKDKTRKELLLWTEKMKLVGTPWVIIIFIEDHSLFVGTKPIESRSILPEFGSAENILTVQYRSLGKISDQYIEIIKIQVRNMLCNSFVTFEKDAREKINPNEITRFDAWHCLLLMFYGFVSTALENFTKIKNALMLQDIDPFCRGTIPPVEPTWITCYPLINWSDPFSVLTFSIFGIMSIHYQFARYKKVSKLFFILWSIAQSKVTNPEQETLVNNWANQSLEAIVEVSELSACKQDFYLNMFFLNLRTNGKKLGEINEQLLSTLDDKRKYTRAAVNARFSNMFGNDVLDWSFGFSAVKKSIENFVQASDYQIINSMSQKLLNNRTPEKERMRFIELLSNVPEKIEVMNPFNLKIKFTSKAFYSKIICGASFGINFRVSTIRKSLNIPFEYDSAILVLEHQYEKDIVEVSVPKIDIHSPITFRTVITKSGNWQLKLLKLKIGNLYLSWPLSSLFIIFVFEFKRPNVKVSFPDLVTISKEMKLTLRIDSPSISMPKSNFTVQFDSDKIQIPDQSTDIFEYQFPNLQFTRIPEEPFVNVDLNFSLLDRVDSSYLKINIKVDEREYDFRFKGIFKFPLECSTRLVTDQFLNIRVLNTTNVPLIIEKAELGANVWENERIDAKEEIFFISPTEHGSNILNIHVKDENGQIISKSFDVNSEMHFPIVEAEVSDKEATFGEILDIILELPKCSYEIIGNSSILLTGKTSSNDFEGGRMKFQVLPLTVDTIQFPYIILNDMKHLIKPLYMSVNIQESFQYSPILNHV